MNLAVCDITYDEQIYEDFLLRKENLNEVSL